MISFLAPLPIGNAVRVILDPPDGAKHVRVLRKTADTISGPADPAAGVVFDGYGEKSFVDITALTNGTTYYYQPFYETAPGVWVTAASQSATPAQVSNLIGVDPLLLIRDRLEAGLKALVQAGELTHEDGYIPCYTAPPLYESTRFPIVSVHMGTATPAMQGLGEEIFDDFQDPFTGEWTLYEGVIFSVPIKVISWSLNSDERITLRRAIAKVLLGNLQVFADEGLSQVSFTQTDLEDMESYAAPMFQTYTDFSCQAALAVDAIAAPASGATLAATTP